MLPRLFEPRRGGGHRGDAVRRPFRGWTQINRCGFTSSAGAAPPAARSAALAGLREPPPGGPPCPDGRSSARDPCNAPLRPGDGAMRTSCSPPAAPPRPRPRPTRGSGKPYASLLLPALAAGGQDPPSSWTSPPVALAELRNWPFRSENAMMFYPRVIALDRLRGRHETQRLLRRCCRHHHALRRDLARVGCGRGRRRDPPPWPAPCDRRHRVRSARASPGRRKYGGRRTSSRAHSEPANSRCRQLWLSRLEISLGPPLRALRHWRASNAARVGSCSSRTLQPIGPARRLQVEAFLETLDSRRAHSAGSMPEESYFVICDERCERTAHCRRRQNQTAVRYRHHQTSDFQAWLVTHQPGGASTCRPSHPNRLATSGQAAWSGRSRRRFCGA